MLPAYLDLSGPRSLPRPQIGSAAVSVVAGLIKSNTAMLTALTSLDLSSNLLKGGEAGRALAALLKAEGGRLASLELSENFSLGPSGGQALAEALKSNHTLTSLNLRACGLGADGAKAIGKDLKGNETLTSLNLAANGIGHLGGSAVLELLKSTKSALVEVDLALNSLGDSATSALRALVSRPIPASDSGAKRSSRSSSSTSTPLTNNAVVSRLKLVL